MKKYRYEHCFFLKYFVTTYKLTIKKIILSIVCKLAHLINDN